MSVQPKIVIVGAGASGIAAATKLLDNGFSDITVLEAEDRIGGRVRSVEFGGSIVDLGAQWVHGESGNLVYQMVKDLDLLSSSHNDYEDITYYLPNGEVVNKNISDRLFELSVKILTDKDTADKHPGTLGNYFVKVYNEQITKQFQNDVEVLKLAKLVENWVHKLVCCWDSSKTWHDMSNTGAFVFHKYEGNQQLNWRKQGYQTILALMMGKLSNIKTPVHIEEKIFLGKEVNQITWNNCVKLRKALVKCADGSIYEADHVIVTASVGVLQRVYKNLFVPELPPKKVNAIENIPLGTVNKILLKFPTKWWSDDVKGFSLLWTDEDRIQIAQDFPHGPKDNGRSWLEDIFGFYVIDSHPNVLLGWVVGPMAADVELLSDEVVVNGCMLLLKRFAGKKFNVCEADEILRSKWNSNPHFCGSYVHVSTNMQEKKATSEDLAEPLRNEDGKQVLLFAGEATHSTRYSTVDGAIETGYREAHRIIDMYKRPEYKKVVIIGAGLAGLGAAKELYENGNSDFIILEAQEHAGGRIKTITVDDRPLDLGAQWLHGKENPLYELAVQHNLLADEKSEEGLGIFARSDGFVYDEYMVKEVDFQVGKIFGECESFVGKVDFPESVGTFLKSRFLDYLHTLEETDSQKQLRLELFDWHVRFQIIDNSCETLEQLSARHWGKYVCKDDISHFNLKYGYKSIVDLLVQDLPKNCIKYNTEVANINHRNNADNRIFVSCKNGKSYICDHVIVTVALGILKELFDLSLPGNHREIIHKLGYYGIGKIYLVFDYKWWGDTKGFQMIWQTDAVLEEESQWIRDITGFEELFNQPNVLIGWIGGQGLTQMEELNEVEVGEQCVKTLRNFFPQFCIPNASRIIRTSWLSDPNFKGSYSHITTECDEFDSVMELLSEPVSLDGVPRIFIAGEAVHPSHYSTTHGAFESGQQQAAALCEYLKRII